MTRATKFRGLMLDWAKTIHEAIGIDSPRVFIATFALFGLLAFGFVGWIVDHGYRVKLREQTVTTPLPSPPVSAPAAPTHTAPFVQPSESRPKSSIEQHSSGVNSPNIATGDNSNVIVNQKE